MAEQQRSFFFVKNFFYLSGDLCKIFNKECETKKKLFPIKMASPAKFVQTKGSL